MTTNTETNWNLGTILKDLDFWQDEAYADYRPEFGIEEQDEKTIWFTDRGRRVALLDQNLNQIELFEFFPGKLRLSNPQKPPVYHAPTFLGARLSLVQWLNAQGRTSDSCEYAVDASSDVITLTVTESWRSKSKMDSVKRVELRVHPRFGYILLVEDEVHSDKPVGAELYNFLVQGLTHHHPERRRYPYVVWRSPARGILKWVSNMASLRCNGHQERAFARTIGTNGWVGFFGEKDWNPVFALAEASGPCTLATCDNLLDEHIMFPNASRKVADDDYELTCRGAMFALPSAVADQLEKRATINDLQPNADDKRMRPFQFNRVCDFETSIPLNEYFRGVFWAVKENSDEWASVTDEKPHSGKWSLRMRVRPEDGEKSMFPPGSTLWLHSGRSYRLSAWVSYVGEKPGRFRLTASQAYMSWAENRDPKEARAEAEKSIDWRRLELTFTAIANDPCIFVQLHASGDGKWFVDDILLEETSK